MPTPVALFARASREITSPGEMFTVTEGRLRMEIVRRLVFGSGAGTVNRRNVRSGGYECRQTSAVGYYRYYNSNLTTSAGGRLREYRDMATEWYEQSAAIASGWLTGMRSTLRDQMM